jgi:monofunctional biosynthetic peptidoglycan transglycosylase
VFGIELLLLLATISGEAPPERTIFDFSAGDDPWPSIDDIVMGGRSASEMRIEGGSAVFTGNVSLERGGGFASVRSRPGDHDLSGYRGVRIRVRGDGKTYGLRIKTDRGFDGVNYQAELATAEGEWREIRIAFDDFRPVFRGRTVPGHPALDPAAVQSFGLIISRKQEGPFRLEIDWIKAYMAP